MFTSADLIEALRRRWRRSIRPQRPLGEFPPGWQAWFDAMPASVGRVTGVTVASILAIFVVREPVYPRGYESLNRWQAFVRLWRYDWRKPDPDDRGTRIAATLLSLTLHALWLAGLLLLSARYVSDALEEEARRGEESVVQVEFIGEGTPDDAAGGAPVVVAEELQAEASPPQVAEAQPQPAARPPLPAPSQAEPQPAPPMPPQPVEQPLQATETPVPDSTFVVPPMRAIEVPAPTVRAPEARVPDVAMRSLDLPPVPPSLRPLPQREATVPDTPRPVVDAIAREVPMPAPRVELRRVGVDAAVPTPEIRREAPGAAARDIPMRAPSPAAASGNAASTPSATTTAGTQRAGAPQPGSGQGTRAQASATGSGAQPAPGAGASPTPRRADDWGDAARNRPGGTQGLFNADGSPRLAGNTGRVGGGLPPGTITEDYEKIDRMGTWLKRPPIGYEPTSFDRFWVPNETLLQEWVRRSIQEVLIPIPGTGKSIRCAVALLALGGACGLFDPNMKDVEAEARPPPDVPFKPELQEDQGSLAQPPPGTP